MALTAVGVVLYVMNRGGGKETAALNAQCPLNQSAALTPLAHGEVAAFNVLRQPKPLTEVSFNGPDGQKRSLGDFRGRTVLLNLWATWCVPCRQEMPALDKLQADLGGEKFEVVAVNIDTARLEKPKAFLQEIGVSALTFYADPKADIFQTLKSKGKVVGLPTTILVDPNGCEIGTMAGPAQWNSGEGRALVEAALGKKS